MEQTAKLIVDGKTYELPIVDGTEGEKGIDIAKLRQETGLITLDPGYANTGSCMSRITFMDGEKGILQYRGIPVEQLAEHSTFVETAYLLLNGELPSSRQLTQFSVMLNDHSLVHEDMREFFENFPAATNRPNGRAADSSGPTLVLPATRGSPFRAGRAELRRHALCPIPKSQD